MNKKRLGPRGGETTVSKTGMIRMTLWLHPDEAEALRKKAYEERRTQAEVLREGLWQVQGLEGGLTAGPKEKGAAGSKPTAP